MKLSKKELIQILIDNKSSWFWEYIENLEIRISKLGFECKILNNPNNVTSGDILIMLSCKKKFDRLYLNKHNLVIHESELPKGRGWSPLTWQILENKNKIPICLFEADQKIDNGNVYFRDTIDLLGFELINEIREKQAIKSFELVLKFLNEKKNLTGEVQKGEPTYYKKRSSENSRLDINKTIIENFNLLRVVDNIRYPAFFELNGEKFKIEISKYENDKKK